MSNYQWISWHQPTGDYRPLNFPPNAAVLGWWCSGYDSDDVPILCALVKATTEDDARKAVKADWPEAERWRFCEQRDTVNCLGTRFVPTEWMVPRLEAELARARQ